MSQVYREIEIGSVKEFSFVKEGTTRSNPVNGSTLRVTTAGANDRVFGVVGKIQGVGSTIVNGVAVGLGVLTRGQDRPVSPVVSGVTAHAIPGVNVLREGHTEPAYVIVGAGESVIRGQHLKSNSIGYAAAATLGTDQVAAVALEAGAAGARIRVQMMDLPA
jgi:hypothetical protein